MNEENVKKTNEKVQSRKNNNNNNRRRRRNGNFSRQKSDLEEKINKLKGML